MIAVHSAFRFAEAPGDDRDPSPTLLDDGDFCRRQVSIFWLCHLPVGGKVDPELEAEHAGRGLGHLLVYDPASGGHPLAAAVKNASLVAEAVPVFYVAADQIGHRLDASVRMPC